jgi:hypothetical protein
MVQGRQVGGVDDPPERGALLSRFGSNEVRLWLSVIAHNSGFCRGFSG